MKKTASILLAVLMLCAFTVPVFARYLYISNISANISMSGDTATCTANVNHSGASATVEIILQISTNGGASYSDYETLLCQDYSGRFIGAYASASNLNTAYTYRTKVVVTVYDSYGRQIDSGEACS